MIEPLYFSSICFMAPDAVSLRILLAATRANQRYEGKGKNEIRDDAAEVMDTLMGRMLLRDAARANNQFSPRNWGTQSRGSWSPRASPRHHTSPRSPRAARSPRFKSPRTPTKRHFSNLVGLSGRPKGTF